MEKNKLRLASVLFLFIFSFACIFAQDGNNDENGDKEAIYGEISSDEFESPALEKQDAAPEPEELIRNVENNNAVSPWVYIIFGFLLLAAVALTVLSHLYLRKIICSEKNNLKKYLDENIEKLKLEYDQKNESIMKKYKYSSNTEDIRDTIETIENDISRLKKEISILDDLKTKVDTLYSGKKMAESISNGKLDVIDAFNIWAVNPAEVLPEAFYYIDGEIKIRTKREIKESAKETKWITNRNGRKKYLLPNPNSFNQMTNIPELYTMDQAKLKGRGQNKIKIITPCEMTKDGFIEFAGELELL